MHVTVTDQLSLSVDKPSGAPNYLAVFTVRNSDSTDVLVDSWQFVPDSGAVFGVGCPTWTQGRQWNCAMNVPVSGTMKVKVSVHYNHWVFKSVHVTVVPCPTNDSLLDDAKIRLMLDSIWKLSNGGNPDIDKRSERGFTVYDSVGRLVIRLSPLDTASSPCQTAITEPYPPPGTVLAQFHVHPFTLNDSLPRACEIGKGLKGGQYLKYANSFGGPSEADWNRTSVVPPRPVYAFDKDSIYKAAPGLPMPYDSLTARYNPDLSQIPNYLSTWSRKGPNCTVIKY